MQPFSFLQIMGKSPALRKLMLVSGVQSCSEGRNINDVFAIFMQQDLHWGWGAINNFVGALGVALVIGGMTVKKMLNTLGLRRFTTVSNITNMIAFAGYSTVSA